MSGGSEAERIAATLPLGQLCCSRLNVGHFPGTASFITCEMDVGIVVPHLCSVTVSVRSVSGFMSFQFDLTVTD